VSGIRLELATQEVENIVGFLGYGSPTDSVWFVGIEEGLGGANSADAVENLKSRGTFDAVMDLRDAHHQRLRENGTLIDFDARPPSTQVWQWMAKIMRAYQDNDNWGDIGRAKEYVRCCLGRSGGATFLTELSPIPSNKTKNKAWLQAFRELDSELDKKIAERREKLLTLLSSSRPRMVICYGDGRGSAREYEQFFGARWIEFGERIKQGRGRACPFLLLPFFGNGQMGHPVIEEMQKLGLLPAPRASKCQ
jgi:hypothetical protein